MTTTCDALWMGMPVLTLPGVTPVSRAGLSLLSSVGLGELAAHSEEEYVRIAVELAGKPDGWRTPRRSTAKSSRHSQTMPTRCTFSGSTASCQELLPDP